MKVNCLLLLAIINAQLAHGTLYATPPNPVPNQRASESAPKVVSAQRNRPSGDGGPNNDTRAGREIERPRQAAKSSLSNRAVAINSTRPGQVAGRQTLAAAGNPANSRPSSATQPSTVERRGSVHNEAIYQVLPVRPGAAIRPASPFAGAVPHRDSNAAVIGGAASSNIRGTAAIDGRRTNLQGPRN